MSKNYFNNKKNILFLIVVAVLFESFTNPLLKIGSTYPFLSSKYLLCFFAAVLVLGVYALIWQIILEYVPLVTAYLRKGLSYILVFLWAGLLFHEVITAKQIVGIVIIFIGMVVSMVDES